MLKIKSFLIITLIITNIGTSASFCQSGDKGRVADFYQNPVNRGMNPDPSICRVGNDYYLVTSSMFFYPGVPIYHSIDLINWKLIGYCLTNKDHFCLDKNNGSPMMYAATLRYHDGTFYMITTEVNGGGNFYVTAKNPAGPWSSPVFIDKPMFDPSLYFDDDGKVYYTRRGSFENKDIVQAEIDINTGKLLTELRSIGKGMVSDDIEGPHLYKVNGWYYLMAAEGGSRALHMETIGRSKSPWGPFEPCPYNPILSQHNAWWHPVKCVGHADLVQSQDGRWWAVYLATRHMGYNYFSNLGRETFLVPFEWQDGWPLVNAQNVYELTVNTKTLPLHPWESGPRIDDFNSETLSLDWNFLAYPNRKMYSLTDRPGYLRLWGNENALVETKQVAFMGKRQKDINSICKASIEFKPQVTTDEAGLTVFQGSNFHYDIFMTIRNGNRVVALRKTVADIKQEAASFSIKSDKLYLKIESDKDLYHFYFSDDNNNWKILGTGNCRLISTEVADVWSGMFYGMYATGNGKTCKNPADFDWFEYKGLDK
jgi:alpha-N-arabinofuranosidase